MEKKMRNWTSFILAIVASVVMVLITLFSMDYLVTIVNEGGVNQQQLEQIIALFKIVYLVIVIIFAIINALFGVSSKREDAPLCLFSELFCLCWVAFLSSSFLSSLTSLLTQKARKSLKNLKENKKHLQQERATSD